MAALVGVFGGTFDPPHIGHLILASEARSRLHLDRLLWVLTPDPPHKQDQAITALKHRLAMVRLAIAGDPSFELSGVEIERPGPQYALDTVRTLAEQDPAASLVYVMGGDSLRDLPSWYHPEQLVARLAFLGVVRRPGDAVDLPLLEKAIPGLSAKVRFVDAPLLEVASHEIRVRAAQGRPFRYFLPAAVYDYIVVQHLYDRAQAT